MASQTNNPFDFTSLLKSYDPQAFFKQMQGGFSAYQLPNLIAVLFWKPRKEYGCTGERQSGCVRRYPGAFKCQSEMLQQAMADATAAAKELASSGNPKELAAKQA